jgi:hypothetical protein
VDRGLEVQLRVQGGVQGGDQGALRHLHLQAYRGLHGVLDCASVADPAPHHIWKLDPDPHKSGKLDTDPY